MVVVERHFMVSGPSSANVGAPHEVEKSRSPRGVGGVVEWYLGGCPITSTPPQKGVVEWYLGPTPHLGASEDFFGFCEAVFSYLLYFATQM